MGVVVRAIKGLQRKDVVGHVALGKTIGFVGVTGEWPSLVAAIAHNREFEVVMGRRHGDVGYAAGLLAVLEAERVTQFMNRSGKIIISQSRG